MAYSIGSLYKTNKETLSDGSTVTVNAHKQFLRVLKELFERAGWNIKDYKENYKSDYSAEEKNVTFISKDDIEQRRLFVSNSREDIFMVFETGCSFTDDAFNIGVWTFPSYDNTKDIHNQDFQNVKTIIASNDSLEYFMSCDDDHLYGFLYISNQYSSHFHLGFFEQFEGKENYPFAVLCETQHRKNEFNQTIPPAKGGRYPYEMGENGSSGEILKYLHDNTTDDMNVSMNNCSNHGYQSLYDRNYIFTEWSPYCTGYPNFPQNGEYGLGEMYIKTNNGTDTYVIPKQVLFGKIKGVYKISGFNIFTKFIVQVGGTSVNVSDFSSSSIKNYVDEIIASGGRAFIVANDLNLISPQNYVALEML